MYKRLAALVVVGLLLTALPAQGQDMPWFVYLYSGSARELLRVNADGSQQSYSLGVDQNTWLSSFDLAFTSDGSRVVFCTVVYPPNSGQGDARLIVRDVLAQSNVLQLDLGKAASCRTGQNTLSPDAALVVLTRMNYYPGDPQADTSAPQWQIQALDLATGNVVQEINANSAGLPEFPISPGMPVIPIVQYVDAQSVIFSPLPAGSDASISDSYLWRLDDGSVTSIPGWGNMGVDWLDATGELIWVDQDETRPAANPGGPLPSNNVLRLADKSGEARTIFYSGDWVLVDSDFVNQGQQIAIQMISNFDMANPEASQETKWMLLDRAGSLTEVPAVELLFGNIADAPDGYVFLSAQWQDNDSGIPAYSLKRVSSGVVTDLWSFASDDPSISWELAWAAPATPVNGLQPFPLAQ